MRDQDDAVVAEAAIDAEADYLVTHNLRHFAEVGDLVSVLPPAICCESLLNEHEGCVSLENVGLAEEGG
jgi:predicted nucleic acid-binding protein